MVFLMALKTTAGFLLAHRKPARIQILQTPTKIFKRMDSKLKKSTDPNDPNSKSDVPTITIIGGLLGGDLTGPEKDGVQGATVPGTPQTAGTNFN